MFNKDFYPTPLPVIEQMLLGVELTNKVILEPSAGKGDIIDFLYQNGAKEVLCCETNEELAVICGSKARLIEKDFIKLSSDKISHIDMIVMNPPFSADEHHINHAFEIAPPGCEIIALCNYNTYEIGGGWWRKAFQRNIHDYGSIENLGNVFSSAERTTDAEIGLVKLFKPKGDTEDEFEGYFDLEEEIEEQGDGIMAFNEIRDTVNRYVGAVNMFDSVLEENQRINQLIKPILKDVSIDFGVRGQGVNDRESFKKELQKSAWRSVFAKLKMQKYTTRSVMDQLNLFVEKQQNVPFTMSNIYKMVEMVVGTHGQRMNKVLVEVFDWLTDHHHENRMSVEGWKTNSMYMVNRKFIAPYCGLQRNWGNGAPEIRWSQQGERMDELVKALCFLTGQNYDNFTSLHDFFSPDVVPNMWQKEAIEDLSKHLGIDIEKAHKLHHHCNNISIKNSSFFQELEYKLSISTEMTGMIKQFYGERNYDRKYWDTTYEYKEWGTWYDFNFFQIKVFKKGTLHAKFKDEKVWEMFNRACAKAKGWRLPTNTGSDARRNSTGVEVFKN